MTITSASRSDAWAKNCSPRRLRGGAGVITSLVRADGFLVLPRGEQGAEAGQTVRVRLVRSQSELDKTIFCIGSHDVILDLLAQFLAEHDRRFISSNVGSQGGLIALKRGEAHLAGSHLLDPETGEYNLAALRQYLPDVPVRLIALVHREQGLMVRRGNPMGIKNLGEPRSREPRRSVLRTDSAARGRASCSIII